MTSLAPVSEDDLPDQRLPLLAAPASTDILVIHVRACR